MLRFAQMVLNRGELDGVRILKSETVDLVTHNHLTEQPGPITLGPLPLVNEDFGWDFGRRVKTSEGKTPGSLGEYWWDGAASTLLCIAPRENLIGIGMTQFMPRRRRTLWMPEKSCTRRCMSGRR